MPNPCSRLLLRSAWILVFFGVAGWALSGCDGGGSKRTSFYERLVGATWSVERLLVNGADYTNQVEQRYASLGFVFRSGEAGRTYSMTGPVAGDTTTVQANGTIELISYRSLQMLGGFSRPVTWTFEFEASDSVIFQVPDGRMVGSGTFLRTILPSMAWGEAQHVELRLVRSD